MPSNFMLCLFAQSLAIS